MTDVSAPSGAGPWLSAVLLPGRTIDELLDLVVAVTVAAVDEVTAASVTYRREAARGYRTVIATSEAIAAIDAVQYHGGGPCVSALESGEERTLSLPSEHWREFSDAATAAGMTTVWSLPLCPFKGTEAIGALNLYSAGGRPWRAETASALRLLAAQAAVLLANAGAIDRAQRLTADLQEALVSRTVIGQAQGILMLRQGIDADGAFEILRRASQRSNRKLRDIATDIVAHVAGPQA